MPKRCPSCHKVYENHFNYCGAHSTAVALISDDPPPARTTWRVEQSVPSGGANASPQIAGGNRWVRRPGEFAARIEPSDLKSLLNKGIIVEEGTQGLLFQNGKMVGVMPPGPHTVESVAQRLRNMVFTVPTSVILIDVSNTVIAVHIPNLRTSSNELVEGELEIVVAVNSPVEFFVSMMKGREMVMVDELAKQMAGWVQDVVEPVVLTSTSDELYANPELRERIELDLRQALKSRFERTGVELVEVNRVRFSSLADTEIRRRRGDFNREKSIAEVDLAYRAFQTQLASDSSKIDMEKIKNEAEFARFLQDMEQKAFRGNMVLQLDRDELTRQFAERKHDQETARRHLLAQVELKRREELERLRHEFTIQELRRSHDEQLLALSHRGEYDTEKARQERKRLDDDLDDRLRRGQMEFNNKLQQQRATFDWELAAKTALAEAERVRIAAQQEQKFADARKGIELYNEQKNAKQKRMHEDRMLESELAMKQSAAEHAQELAKAARFNELNPAALIAMAPAEQAALLAELQRTETLRGMSEAQIMALSAKDSPEIARALAEKFRAAGSSAQEASEQAAKLYERMLADKDAMLQTFQNMHRDVLRSTQELAQNAMNVQRDTATAASTPVIVQSAANSAPFVHAHPHCTACHSHSSAGSRFCQSCGQPFGRT